MNDYSQLKSKVQELSKALEGCISRLDESGLVGSSQSARWQSELVTITNSIKESLFRIAVVGAVKSGKSTLINALSGTDLLKRGAGITTSFTTRIRNTASTGGWIKLKPWSQINEEITRAARMLPILEEENNQTNSIDLRQLKHRDRLDKWLVRIQQEWQRSSIQLDTNFLILNAYLEGYEQVKDKIGESAALLALDAGSIVNHKNFVASESQAVYVQDMELNYPMAHIEGLVELADCQGSDAPNPLHLAQVQQYLLRSHLILYVISSRTGLREADFKLIDFIKKLRMIPQTFFILNVDLDTHLDYQDVKASIARVEKELEWVAAKPSLFAFSALYMLLQQLGEKAPPRDKKRLELWSDDQKLIKETEKEFQNLCFQLNFYINDHRTRLLLDTAVNRLAMIATTLLENIEAQEIFIKEDLEQLRRIAGRLERSQEIVKATVSTVTNAVVGLQDSIKKETSDAVHSYFDLKNGPIVQETFATVDTYPVNSNHFRELANPHTVLRRLPYFYLEFRRDLARYLVEKVNRQIVEFVKAQETLLEKRLVDSYRAFRSMFLSAMEDYRQELSNNKIGLRSSGLESIPRLLPEKVAPPVFSGFLEGNALSRGMLIMKFGIGRLSRFLNTLQERLGRGKDGGTRVSQREETAKEAISLVKSEIKAELSYAFRDYRQKLLYSHLLKLVDISVKKLLDEFKARAELVTLDFTHLFKLKEVKEENRREALNTLRETKETITGILKELEELPSKKFTHPLKDPLSSSP